MISSTIEAGNTGRVHIGRNYTPSSTLGQPNTGDILIQGGEVSESKRFPGDTIFQGDVWLVGSAADQRLSVEEVLKD